MSAPCEATEWKFSCNFPPFLFQIPFSLSKREGKLNKPLTRLHEWLAVGDNFQAMETGKTAYTVTALRICLLIKTRFVSIFVIDAMRRLFSKKHQGFFSPRRQNDGVL